MSSFDEMTITQLKAMAQELGVLPQGRPSKKALIKALEPGGPPKPVEETSQQKYLLDRMYEVMVPFGGYERGDQICNLARSLGLAMVDNGNIRLVKSSPQMSNPNAIAVKKK